MFAEPERTRYDLNFRLLGFPVRVHPLFWLVAAIFGAGALDEGVEFLLAWIAIVFASILVHELGHSFAFRLFKTDSHIVLHGFGGLAIPWSAVRGRGRRIGVALAGPTAGFLLGGLILGSNYLWHWGGRNAPSLPQFLFWNLVFVNLGWGLLNLLPVWPLDGGQVSQEICTHFSPRSGQELSLQISIVIAGIFCLYSLACVLGARQGGLEWIEQIPPLYRGTLWMAILFGMLAVQSYQVLQRVKWNQNHWQ